MACLFYEYFVRHKCNKTIKSLIHLICETHNTKFIIKQYYKYYDLWPS